jgi:hypothetical protein
VSWSGTGAPVTGTAYATAAQVRAYLGQVTSDDDTLLGDILVRATAFIDDALGFHFAAWGVAASADFHTEYGGRYLTPPAFKAASVTAVALVYSKGATTESTAAITDYVDLGDGRLYRDCGWSPGWYRVTAVWGYGPAPKSIEEVCIEVAINMWHSKDRAAFTDALGTGSGATTGPDGLSGGQRAIIQRVHDGILGVVFA